MTKERKGKPPIVFDQSFIEAFQPHIIEMVSGVEITGRMFTIAQWRDLKARFKKWQGFNVGDLMLEYDFEAVLHLCWCAVGGLNDDIIPTIDHLEKAMTAKNYMEWAKVWRPACGLPVLSNEEDDAVVDSEQDPGNVEAEAQK